MTADKLAREEILAIKKMAFGAHQPGAIRLNANEAPDTVAPDDGSQALNRYPEAYPDSLQKRLSELLEVPTANLLITRGSSEGIDIVIRTFCRAYVDSIVSMPPTFELYPFFAKVQGVECIEVHLQPDEFRVDHDALRKACREDTKVIFICSPNNPTGSIVPAQEIFRIAAQRRGKSLVVVDEAYIEFSGQASVADAVLEYGNLIVLRTLSKAHALAGARCGVAISNPELIDLIARVLPPFSFATPVVEEVGRALTPERLAADAKAIAVTVAERERMFTALTQLELAQKVWPGFGNFLLFKVSDQERVLNALDARRIMVRAYGKHQHLENCLRVTIGAPPENDALLEVLESI